MLFISGLWVFSPLSISILLVAPAAAVESSTLEEFEERLALIRYRFPRSTLSVLFSSRLSINQSIFKNYNNISTNVGFWGFGEDSVLQENRYHVLRFLAEDIGLRLDEILDEVLRVITHRKG